MKAGEAARILNVTPKTIFEYRKKGLLKATKTATGRYIYDRRSVYQFLNNNIKRKNYIYARVSTYKQKKDLENQITNLKDFSKSAGYTVDGIYSDIASGISFEKRKNFFKMLDKIIAGEVDRVIISYKDRLSRVGFELFTHLFSHYGCEIVVMSDVGSKKLDTEEIFEEIVSLLHCYSMKLYSKRKNKKIKELIEEE